jgi:hypothetical protein
LSTSAWSCGVVPIGGVVGIGFGEGDELLHCGGAEIRHHREHVRRDRELADGGEILERIVGRRVVEAGVDRVGAGRQQDRKPSASARATYPMPILPPPPLFSTTTEALIASCIARCPWPC